MPEQQQLALDEILNKEIPRPSKEAINDLAQIFDSLDGKLPESPDSIDFDEYSNLSSYLDNVLTIYLGENAQAYGEDAYSALRRALFLDIYVYFDREENRLKERKFSSTFAFMHPMQVGIYLLSIGFEKGLLPGILHDVAEDSRELVDNELYKDIKERVKNGESISEKQRKEFNDLVSSSCEKIVNFVYGDNEEIGDLGLTKTELSGVLDAVTKRPWETIEKYHLRAFRAGETAILVKTADKINNVATDFEVNDLRSFINRVKGFRKAQAVLDMLLAYRRTEIARKLIEEGIFTEEEYNAFVGSLDKPYQYSDETFIKVLKAISEYKEKGPLARAYNDLLEQTRVHYLPDDLISRLRSTSKEHFGISNESAQRIEEEVNEEIVNYYNEGGFNKKTRPNPINRLDGLLDRIDKLVLNSDAEALERGIIGRLPLFKPFKRLSRLNRYKNTLLIIKAFEVLIHKYNGEMPVLSENGEITYEEINGGDPTRRRAYMWNEVGNYSFSKIQSPAEKSA